MRFKLSRMGYRLMDASLPRHYKQVLPHGPGSVLYGEIILLSTMPLVAGLVVRGVLVKAPEIVTSNLLTG